MISQSDRDAVHYIDENLLVTKVHEFKDIEPDDKVMHLAYSSSGSAPILIVGTLKGLNRNT